MQNSLRANIELTVNIVIAVSILVVAGLLVKRYAFSPQRSSVSLQQQSDQLVGTRILIPNVDWAQNKKSLIFFLNKDCAYCTASAPFYRELIQEAAKRNIKWLAILPNSVEEGRQYLHSLDLPIDNVQSGSLSAFRIQATPTVVFVDNQGTVKGIWVGAVPGREREMRDKLLVLFDAEISGGLRQMK